MDKAEYMRAWRAKHPGYWKTYDKKKPTSKQKAEYIAEFRLNDFRGPTDYVVQKKLTPKQLEELEKIKLVEKYSTY